METTNKTYFNPEIEKQISEISREVNTNRKFHRSKYPELYNACKICGEPRMDKWSCRLCRKHYLENRRDYRKKNINKIILQQVRWAIKKYLELKKNKGIRNGDNQFCSTDCTKTKKKSN